MAQTGRSILEGHKVIWTPKTTTEYANLLSQNAVDTILAVCIQLRATGQHRDTDLACSIEGAIRQYTVK
jgi:hypothetical protein